MLSIPLTCALSISTCETYDCVMACKSPLLKPTLVLVVTLGRVDVGSPPGHI